MKLYLEITRMEFKEDDIEHNIIRGILNEEFIGYDKVIIIPDNDKFIKDTMRETEEGIVFDIREKNTWWGYPLYELRKNKIVKFNWENYSYFADTDRRNMLAKRINQIYNPPSEAKILRKALKILFDESNVECPEFQKYYNKIEDIINKNPKKHLINRR